MGVIAVRNSVIHLNIRKRQDPAGAFLAGFYLFYFDKNRYSSTISIIQRGIWFNTYHSRDFNWKGR